MKTICDFLREHEEDLFFASAFLGVLLAIFVLVPVSQTVCLNTTVPGLCGTLGLNGRPLFEALLLSANYGTVWAGGLFYLVLIDKSRLIRFASLLVLVIFAIFCGLNRNILTEVWVAAALMLYFAVIDRVLMKSEADRERRDRLLIGSVFISWPAVAVMLIVLAGFWGLVTYGNAAEEQLQSALAGVFAVVVINSNLQFCLLNAPSITPRLAVLKAGEKVTEGGTQ